MNQQSNQYDKNNSNGGYSQNYNSGGYEQNNSNGNYSQNYNNGGYGQDYSNGGYSQNYNNGSYNQNYSSGGYGQNGNYAVYQNQNGYYQQNYESQVSGRGGVSDIIFGIIGIIANLLLVIAAFVPVLSGKYYSGKTKNIFFWSFFKSIGRLMKHLHYDNIFSLSVQLIVVIMILLIAVISFVYLIIYIVDLCGRKEVSGHLNVNFCVILTLFFIEYMSLKTMVYVKVKSVSAIMMIIALCILLFSSILSGYLGHMQLAKQSAKTYHLQFVFNCLVGLFSGMMVLFSFSAIVKPKYATTAKYGLGVFISGFFGTLSDIIGSIDKRYYSSLSEVKSDCKMLSLCLVLALMTLTIVVYQIKNLKEAVKNINCHFNVGSRILVRSVFTIILLVAMQIVIAANRKTLLVKSSPETFFIVMMIFSCLNIIILIVKKVLEAAVPDTCVELVQGTKNKLRQKTISCIVLNSIGTVMLIGIFIVSSFTYNMIEKVAKDKIRDIYDSYYDDYKDYYDEYKDYYDEYKDSFNDYGDWD